LKAAEEVDVMSVILVVIAAAVTTALIIAVALVSVASRREDREWTLAGNPPGPGCTLARRIVGFHSRGIEPLLYARGRQAGQHLTDVTRHNSEKLAA
jgi:hypothetical protein